MRIFTGNENIYRENSKLRKAASVRQLFAEFDITVATRLPGGNDPKLLLIRHAIH